MPRDLLLSGVLGFATGGAGTYALHRALWKTSDAQATRIEALIQAHLRPVATSSDKNAARATSALHQPDETLERYMRQRSAQAWNALVDSVHLRLLNFPRTVEQIRGDASALVASVRGPAESSDPPAAAAAALVEPDVAAAAKEGAAD